MLVQRLRRLTNITPTPGVSFVMTELIFADRHVLAVTGPYSLWGWHVLQNFGWREIHTPRYSNPSVLYLITKIQATANHGYWTRLGGRSGHLSCDRGGGSAVQGLPPDHCDGSRASCCPHLVYRDSEGDLSSTSAAEISPSTWLTPHQRRGPIVARLSKIGQFDCYGLRSVPRLIVINDSTSSIVMDNSLSRHARDVHLPLV